MKQENITPKQEQQSKMLSFSMNPSTPAPKFIERSGKDWIAAGQKNDWFQTLIDLKNSAPFHKSIMDSLSRQIKGQGFRVKKGKEDNKLNDFIDKCNQQNESLNDILEKLIKDYLLFGGFSLYANEGQKFNSKGEKRKYINHTDFSCLRVSKNVDIIGQADNFWFSNNWLCPSPKTKEYKPFSEKSTTGIYYYKGYESGLVYYPLPSYVALIPTLQASAKVWTYTNSLLDNSFMPSLFINLPNGIPSPEKQDEIYEQTVAQFQGSENAGKVILNYSNGADQAAEVTPINNNDNDQKYGQLRSDIIQEILSGWAIPSGELLAVQEISKLGSGNLLEAQDLLFTSCIQPRQKIIEDEINFMLSQMGFEGELEIIPIEKIITADEAITTVLAIQKSIKEGASTVESGKKMLTKFYGFDTQTAEELIGSKEEKNISTSDSNVSVVQTGSVENDIQAQAQAALRGSVGGVQGVLQIQQGVSAGLTDYDAAIEMLSTFYGITEDKARILLGKPKLASEVETVPII